MKNFPLLLLLFSMAIYPQSPISGIVKDSKTNFPLAFATIIPETGRAVIADFDGRFTIENAQGLAYFMVTYTGYTSKKIRITGDKRYYSIQLDTHIQELGEVTISNANPANGIIREAIKRKISNDPQQKLESFKYKAYERLIVTANPDSISGKLDSVYVYEKAARRLKIDSTGYKFKKMITAQHLYQTEKVSEFRFNSKSGLKETVLATRMAGFKQPLYELIGLTLQSYSVYAKNIELLETKYEGPVADGALNEYNYRILDTVAIDNRSVYMVYFTPKRKKRKKLSGVLYIDRNNYGIAKAILRVKNVLDITSTHYYSFEEAQGLWFRDRRTLKIVKGNNKEDIRILGETIKFDAVGKNETDREKEPSDYVYLLSETVNFEKEFNVPVNIKRPGVAIQIGEEAINRPESYWNTFRSDSTDTRSFKTYTALDSLVAKDNWEQRIFLGRKIINGYLPLGPFDLDLRSLIKYNNYEGFRLGAGGVTNDRFAETFRISGYGAYGTKDGRFKYSIGAAVRVGKFSNSWIGGSYTDDVKEIASTSFATDKRVFKIYDPRPFNLTTFYNHQTWQLYAETRILRKTESNWQLTKSRIDPKFPYVLTLGDKQHTLFNITTASASLQWNPLSEYMQTPTGRIEIEKRFPKFTFQYTQSLAGVLDSDFTFGKLDFRTEYEKKYLNGQTTSVLVQSGVAAGDTPLTHLYSTSPNNLDRETILQRITFAGKNSFETMYFNEFFSSQYMIVQLKHALRKYTLFSKVKLSPVFVTRFAWGNMENREKHAGIEYNTLEKGYYESGLEFNEIFKGFGLTGFYRYGPYHLPQFDRNISVKVSFVLNLF